MKALFTINLFLIFASITLSNGVLGACGFIGVCGFISHELNKRYPSKAALID